MGSNPTLSASPHLTVRPAREARKSLELEDPPMVTLCDHFETGVEVDAPLDVCSTCVEIGSTWYHLRQCLNCGRTLCCDNSPNRHMSGHWRDVGHPMMRSAQPGEDWRWCFPDELFFVPGPNGYEVAED